MCPDVGERGGECVRDNQLNISDHRDAEAEGGPRSQVKGSSRVWRALGSAFNGHTRTKKVRDLHRWRRR